MALLLKKVQQKQVGHHEDEEVRVDVDFSEDTIQTYGYYTQSVLDHCKEQFEIGGGGGGPSSRLVTFSMKQMCIFARFVQITLCSTVT